MRGEGRVAEVKEALKKSMRGRGTAVEVMQDIAYNFPDHPFAVQVYEKYYMRVSNRLTLTVTYSQIRDNLVELVITGSVAAKTVFFSLSWGSEHNLVEAFAKMASAHGFTYVIDPDKKDWKLVDPTKKAE